jgi:hypothetical protein
MPLAGVGLLIDRFVDGCLNPSEFGDMGSAAVAGSD